MGIIGFSVWVSIDDEIDITYWELDQEDEMERYVGAQDSAMVFPVVNVTVI